MIKITGVNVSIDSDGTREDQEKVLDFVAKLRNLIIVDSDQFCKVDVHVKNKIVPALAEINIKGVENGN